jgi:hypothetical protein
MTIDMKSNLTWHVTFKKINGRIASPIKKT